MLQAICKECAHVHTTLWSCNSVHAANTEKHRRKHLSRIRTTSPLTPCVATGQVTARMSVLAALIMPCFSTSVLAAFISAGRGCSELLDMMAFFRAPTRAETSGMLATSMRPVLWPHSADQHSPASNIRANIEQVSAGGARQGTEYEGGCKAHYEDRQPCGTRCYPEQQPLNWTAAVQRQASA
jgi:hypothetical protein